MPPKPTNPLPHLAIAGATGVVGREAIAILEEREFPLASLRLFSSARSAGSTIDYRSQPVTVEELTADSFEGVDLAIFSAGGDISRAFAPEAFKRGCTVIDNSSAFRMTPGVPLVVPEVNGDELDALDPDAAHIIANPNCSTIILLMALTPLRNAFGIERIVVSTYQAASGAGAEAMQELAMQSREVLDGKPTSQRVFPEPCAFNVFSHNTPIGENGYNVEEQKIIDETRKIWQDENVRLTATCMRVPVMRAHCESVNVTLSQAIPSIDAVREVLAAFPGVKIIDDRLMNDFPTSLKAANRDEVLIGRIRTDVSQPNTIDLFLAGDQLRKGAALNAIQIAERLIQHH